MTQEEHKNTIPVCRDGFGKAKTHPELNQDTSWATHMSIYKSTSCKRKTRVNVSLLLTMPGDLVTKNMKKTEVLNVFSALDFTDKICLQEPQAPATAGKV